MEDMFPRGAQKIQNLPYIIEPSNQYLSLLYIVFLELKLV